MGSQSVGVSLPDLDVNEPSHKHSIIPLRFPQNFKWSVVLRFLLLLVHS